MSHRVARTAISPVLALAVVAVVASPGLAAGNGAPRSARCA
jgi:hypothetical protein